MKGTDGDAGLEQHLHAYVDDELAPEERAAVECRIAAEPGLGERIRRLRGLKRSLRDAYPALETPMRGRPRRGPGIGLAAAALVAGVMIGLGIGRVGGARPAPTAVAVSEVAEPMTRVLLHVGSGNAEAMSEALASARYILEDFAREARPVRVHVVANGPGLNLLRRDATPFAERIRRLEGDFANVQFVACQNTIDRLEEKRGEPVRLLPEVLRVDSGVAEIARKRARGWLYIGV